jgi:hypothetical protein
VTKEVVWIDSKATCLADVPTDDYESWNGELPVEFHRDKTILYVDDSQIYQGVRRLTSCLESIGPKSLLLKSHEVVILNVGGMENVG